MSDLLAILFLLLAVVFGMDAYDYRRELQDLRRYYEEEMAYNQLANERNGVLVRELDELCDQHKRLCDIYLHHVRSALAVNFSLIKHNLEAKEN